MKKTFITLVAMLFTSFAAEALQVGDFYVDNQTGVPSIVVYLDASGQHGLLMAPQAYSIKDYNDFCKLVNKNRPKFEKRADKQNPPIDKREEQFNIVWEWLKTAPRYEKLKVNHKSPIFNDVAALNTTKGVENQQAIIKYCKDNNVDLGAYFFEVNWAKQLGDGWFIPGNHELELFSLSFGNGLGDDNKIKYQSWLDNHNSWLDRLGLMSLPSLHNNWMDPHAMFPDYNINSSTLQPNSRTQYYKLNIAIKTPFAVWYLYYGSEESGRVVAFKYF